MPISERIVDSKKDPYLWIKERYNSQTGEYEYYDEVLKNLFGIEDPEELKIKEAEVCMAKLINIESVFSTKFDKDYFKKLTDEELINHLKHIAELENITITEDAIEEIAYLSEGGCRDALSILNQLSTSNNEISLDTVLSNMVLFP